jgi:hypothetical protein
MNKILCVFGNHDCGKFVVINSLKNNPDIFFSDYMDYLFKEYNNNLNKVLNNIDQDITLDKLKFFTSKDIKNAKYNFLNCWNPIDRILSNIDNVTLIFLFRDIRVCWLLSEHKKEGSRKFYDISIDKYIKLFNDTFNMYLSMKSRENVLMVKFEDFLTDKLLAYKKLCNELDICYESKHIPSFFRRKNTMFSMFDIEKIVKFRNYVNDDQLSYISSKTKKYNEFFGYPLNLSKNEMIEGLLR